MRVILLKILCWIMGVGIVGYVGLNIINSIPSLRPMTGRVPIMNQIPTPLADAIVRNTVQNNCKSEDGKEVELIKLTNAPESEGSYPRWECLEKNPEKSEAEFEELKVLTYEYKKWPQEEGFDSMQYAKVSCIYWDRVYYAASGGVTCIDLEDEGSRAYWVPILRQILAHPEVNLTGEDDELIIPEKFRGLL